MLGFDQIQEVSLDDARDEILEILEDVGFAATSWQEFSIPRTCVDIGAWIWSEATKIAVALKNAGFNETATGDALSRFSKSRYQNVLRAPVAEIHRVTLTCAAGEGPHTIEAGQFKVQNPSGYVFANVPDTISQLGPTYPAAYPLTIPEGGSVQVLLQAELPGDEARTPIGLLTTAGIVTTLSGVTLSDTEVVRVGVATESPESLRRRNSLKWALLSFGLMDDTVEALARDASEAVDRVYVNSTNPRGAGTLDTYITGAEGNVGTADKQAVYDAVQRRIMHDPDETASQVLDAPLQPLNIAGTIYVAAGYDWENVVLPAIEEALEAFRRRIPLGGFAYPLPGNFVPLNEIEDAIRHTKIGDIEPVKTVKLTAPLADVPVASFAHVTRGTWSFTPSFVISQET